MPGALLGGLPTGGVLDALAGISRHRLLDRLIRGRAWIGVVAFALIGIVAMQLWIVKLGTGIGRALESEARLQRENSVLSIEDAKFSAGERVEALAAAGGMVPAAPGTVRFDASHGALDARLAAAALSKSGQVQPVGGGEGLGEHTTSAVAGSASESASTSGEAAGSQSAAGSEAAESAPSAEGSTSTSASSEGSSAGAAGTSSEGAPTQGASTATGTAESSSTQSSGGSTSAAEGAGSSGAGTSESAGAVGASGGTEQPATGG